MLRYRKAAYRRQKGLCWWCKEKMHVGPPHNHDRQCSADHVVRLADGGETVPSNIVAACRKCNESRDQEYCSRVVPPVADPARSSPFDVLKGLVESNQARATKPE